MTAEPNNHDTWRESAALYALGALSAEEFRAFEAHLASCPECTAEVADLQPVVGALARAVPQYDPPENLKARVTAAAVRQGSPPVGRRVDSVAPIVSPSLDEGGSAMRWIGLAAMLVLTVGLAGYTFSLRARVSSLESQLNLALAQSADRLAQVETTKRTLDTTQRHLDVLAAPDTARIALAGQAPSPNAVGRADWSRSRGLALTAANLPALRPGRTYQVWLLTDGAPVSAGLLQPDQTGRASAVYSTAADVREPTGVALSEEPEAGVPLPTGQIYLVGQRARAE